MSRNNKSPHLARFEHLDAALRCKEFRPTGSDNVLVIGKSGAGKSSIISLLIGRDAGIKHGLSSGTIETTEYDFYLPEEHTGRKVKLIDTRGVLDTEVTLQSVLESFIDGLTGRFYHVNTIMLVIDCARFTPETQDALTTLCLAFGLDDVERSNRLLVAVTKLENQTPEQQEEVLQSVIEHAFFKKLGISEDYMRQNTVKVYAGQSQGLPPAVGSFYEELRVESKKDLLRRLAQHNLPMTISNDFAQRVVNFLAGHMGEVKLVAGIALKFFLEQYMREA